MRLLVLRNLSEEIQDYIAANSGLGYIVGTNFTIENVMDYTDLERLLGSRILLTMFDEGGELRPSARLTHQERLFRFVVKGTHPNDSMDRARDLLKWLWDKKFFETATFRVWIAHVLRLPTVIVKGESGSTLSDFLISILVFNKV